MVLDAKAMTWAARHDIDTAKLKKAKVPIYGKWYFPELPRNEWLVNLETGERQRFAGQMLAGEVIWAPEAQLRQAGLLPADVAAEWDEAASVSAPATEPSGSAAAPEPLLMMTRPPVGVGAAAHTTTALAVVAPAEVDHDQESAAAHGIHMPLASIAPFVLGIGFCLVLLGLITNAVILIVGLIWMLVGAVGWIRIGLLEYAAAHSDTAHADAADRG